MLSKIAKYIKDPVKIIFFLQNRCNFPVLPDKLYLKISYRNAMGKKLDLKNPKTFTEKLQWLKLYDRKPAYTAMVDKCEAKKYVADRIGAEHIIPTLGVWERFEDIDFDALPEQFVLKCTHDSGGLVIVKDKAKLDIPAARKKLEKSLRRNYFYSGREWPYKNIQPRIIAEQYLSELNGLKDYKLYCFSGEVKLILVVQGRETPHVTGDYFDENGKPLELLLGFSRADICPALPESFQEMKRLAMILSEGIPHVRVDLYETNGNIYFGELTFFDGSGMDKLEPETWDFRLGDMLTLPASRYES